jgi:acetolactate synthase-1/2/3 large subunit
MSQSQDTAAERLVQTLRRLGVDDVFALCGNHLLPIIDAARRDEMRVIAVRAEASAVMAADAYARINRKVGVVLVTGGPGLANAVSALLSALGNRSPLVLFSGEPEQAQDGRGQQQEVDHLALARTAVKWSASIRDADRLEALVLEAFKIATSGPTGPVHLTIPLDVQRELVTTPAQQPIPVVEGVPSREFTEQVAELLRGAERPAIVAGAGLWLGSGEDATAKLVEATGLPLFTLDSARGIVADSAPSVFGSADASLNRAARRLRDADVVVVLGRPIDFRLGLGATLGQEATVVHVDTDAAALGRNLGHPLACLADPAGFVPALTEALADYRAPDEWLDALRAEREQEQRELDEMVAAAPDVPAHPVQLARALARVGNEHGAIFALDCGEFMQWCRQVIPSEGPGRWLRLGPQSACGAGLPAGLGARVAAPDVPVLVLAGDGGIGYHISELETAVREGLPVVVVVGQDDGWGIERNLQKGIYGDDAEFTTVLSSADLAQVARGWGADAVACSTVAEVEQAVAAAFASGRPTLVQVPVATVPSQVTHSMVAKERRAAELVARR